MVFVAGGSFKYGVASCGIATGSSGSQGGILSARSGTDESIPILTSRIAQRYDIRWV